MDKIIIFDTTLRDGEQAPGASLNIQEKLSIAQALSDLGVDVLEAGFPISSRGDFDAVKAVAMQIKGCSICALARSVKKDIDTAWQAVKPARRPRIHIFLATSRIHMKYKLKKAEDEILRLAVQAVKYAKRFCPDIEFSPEDASRSEREFLFKVIEAVIENGAATVNIPDTVGYAEPEEFGDLISAIKNKVPNVKRAVISVHCHNDLGLAVANSLEAVKNGARQVECTINGIGERAGNASLEEIVMSLDVRKDIFAKVKTGIKKKQLYKTSRLVSKLTGFVIAPNKAIVGSNAFRHEAGIHQDGILKRRATYEIIRPGDVGFTQESLVLGKHSGRHAFLERLRVMGFRLKGKELDRAFLEFKRLADKKKEIFENDLVAIAEDQIHKQTKAVLRLVSFKVSLGTGIRPEAEVVLKYRDKKAKAVSSGDGPVDACFKAVDKIARIPVRLVDYRLEAVTQGKDAQGSVILNLIHKGKNLSGRSSSTDIIEASILAYINALNRTE